MLSIPTSPGRPPRRKTWGLVFLGVLVIAAVVSVIAFTLQQRERAGRARLDGELNAIRRADEPITDVDLAKRHPGPSPEQDAGRLLAQASARFFAQDVRGLPLLGAGSLPAPTAPLGEKLFARLAGLVQTNRAAMDLVRVGELEHAWINGSASTGLGGSVQSLVQIRMISMGLLLAAVAEAESGEIGAALEDWKSGLALGQVFRGDTLREHFYRRLIERQAAAVLERIVNWVEVDAAGLGALEMWLAREGNGGLREAFLSHRVENIRVLGQFRSEPIETLRSTYYSQSGWWASFKSGALARYVSWSGGGYRTEDHVRILEVWRQVLDALEQPPRERQAQLDRFSTEAQGYAQRGRMCWAYTPLSGLAAHAIRDTEAIARLRCARLALAVLRWRSAHSGNLPDSLNELVPDTLPTIPEDPFDQQPLRYRRLAKGFAIYSIGADFADSGGRNKPGDAEKPDGYDLVFAVER